MHFSTVSATLALAGAAFAAPSAQPSFTPVQHAPPTPQTAYQLVYRGPDNLHCNNAGPTGYHYNVTTFNPEPYTEFSSCKNLFNPARAFQIGVKPSSDQFTAKRYNNEGNYELSYLLFFSEPNCGGEVLGTIPQYPKDALKPVPPPGPMGSTYGTCYENSRLARSAELTFGTVAATK